MSKSLIICPVGSPITFDERFNKEEHWRFVNQKRLYETLVFQYSDFVPENNTYDYIIKKKGFKWNLSKEWLKNNSYSQYEYIGFLDDDLITDIDNVNRSIELAKNSGLKLFQMSVTQDSDIFYPILKNDPNLTYSITNFNEVMGMFIHTSLIPICQELWEMYDIYSGWGFDKVICDITQTDAAVIHISQMYHPKRSGNYDKSAAFREMDDITLNIAPKFIRDKYNINWSFRDVQHIKNMFLKIT
jgi:hypothetical protein